MKCGSFSDESVSVALVCDVMQLMYMLLYISLFLLTALIASVNSLLHCAVTLLLKSVVGNFLF